MRHADEEVYDRNLRTLWLRVEELPGVDYVKECCMSKPFDMLYLVKDAAAWCRELELERRQRGNMRGFGSLGGTPWKYSRCLRVSAICFTYVGCKSGNNMRRLVCLGLQHR